MTDALLDRLLFPCLEDSVYLNQAALGLIGQPATQTMHEFLDSVARHGNLKMDDDEEVEFFESLRALGGELLNCDTESVAILSCASELLGQLPFLIHPPAGKHVLAVSTDFPALTRPWLRYAQANDCEVRFVDDDPACDLTDRIIENIDSSTAVVAVSLVQYATGTLIDVGRLRQATLTVGARLVVDVTQAAGAVKVDARSWGADAVVTSGYKWLGGHGGVALGTVSHDLLNQAPILPGWMGAPDAFDFDATRVDFAPGGRRFTQSTMSYVSMAGLKTAIQQLLSLGMDKIEHHARGLAMSLVEDVEETGWTPFREIGDSAASSHLVSLAHPTMNAAEIAEKLRKNRVVCGVRNGRIRVSIAPFNNSEDVSALVAVLKGP